MKTIKLIINLSIIMSIVGCSSTSKIKLNETYTSESGLQYVYTEKGDGIQANAGDKVSVHYTGKLTNDTVFDSSVKRGKPFEFSLGQGQVIKGWDEGIALMKVGDKMTLIIPPELGYGEKDMGVIPSNSTLVFDVELINVKPGVKPLDVTGKDTLSTQSGLKYIIMKKGEGARVKADMKVKAHYSGYFEDGKKFDSSVDRGEPIEFVLGKNSVIKGWEEGLTLLSVGDIARLIIPYHLAYGEKGRAPVIPPKSNLIFDVEILNVEKMIEPKPYDVSGKDTLTTASGLKYIKVAETTGIQAKAGDTVIVHYTGFFEDGKIFDSSIQRGQPFEFQLGQGKVIPGWDEGLSLMKIGEKTRFIIPYQLGYGEEDFGPISGKSTLVFDVELLGIK